MTLMGIAFSFAVVGGVVSLVAYRRSDGSPIRAWSVRASRFLTASLLIGTGPAVFFPNLHWLSNSCLLLSLVLTAASFYSLWRYWRALRAITR